MQQLQITLPNDETIALLPCPIEKLGKLRGLLIAIQSAWIEANFSVADAILTKGVWDKMKKAIALLPRQDNPATTWDALELLSNDYSQLAALFFAKGDPANAGNEWKVNVYGMTPARLMTFHFFSQKAILQECIGILEKGTDKVELVMAMELMANYVSLMEAGAING